MQIPQYIATEERVGSAIARHDAREMSRQIEEWRNQNFEDMHAIAERFIGKELPPENLELPPLIMRATIDHAVQYINEVRRTFPGTMAQQQAAAELYAELDVDGVMQEGQRQSLGQNSVLVGLLPSLTHPRRWNLTTWIYADVEHIDMGQSPLEPDLRYAKEVRLWHPWQNKGGGYELVSLVFTATQAYYEVDGGKVGVYQPNLGHPFGLVPVIGVRTAKPTKSGKWLPHPAQDLWAGQVIVSCAPSDALRQIQVMSPGLQVLSGTNVATLASKGRGKRGEGPKITRGPNNILLLPVKTAGDDPAAKFEYHKLEPQTAAYIAAWESYLGQLASYRYLDVQAIRGGESAEATRELRADLYAYRLAQEKIWRRAEGHVHWLVTTWHNAKTPLKLPTSTPKVVFRYPKRASNDLQGAQATWLRSAMGQLDIYEELDTPGEQLTADERKARVRANIGQHLELVQELKGYVPPGLDSIASQTGLGGASDVATTTPDQPAPAPPGYTP